LLRLTRRDLLGLTALPAAFALAPAISASPRPIAEEGFVSIGGIEQWVAIRGHDRSRTAILFLHGGPCDVQSPHLSAFAPWEERYVVAQWDQRGSGKTFEKGGPSTPNMDFTQIAQDAVEVAQHVLRRLKARKLILVGHSWGAIVGISAIRLRPELFYALVTTAEPVNGREIIESMRASAITRARAAADAGAVAELQSRSALDLVEDMNEFFSVLLKWTAPFPASDMHFLETTSILPPNIFCLSKLMPSIVSFDARAAGYDLPVPFFVIQGSEDNRTPAEAARAFVEQVRAPAKRYTAIEGGHFAFVTNPTGFLNALDSDIRSLGDLVT
jgi:pimeloyl-ACP methyl ester carboxylesterase